MTATLWVGLYACIVFVAVAIVYGRVSGEWLRWSDEDAARLEARRQEHFKRIAEIEADERDRRARGRARMRVAIAARQRADAAARTWSA